MAGVIRSDGVGVGSGGVVRTRPEVPEGVVRIRPEVVVLCRPDPRNRRCLRELGAGMEEEGVPFRVEDATEDGTELEVGDGADDGTDHGVGHGADDGAGHGTGGGAVELAFAAAQASHLDVGVGVDATGNVCVHHAKLPPDAPALSGTASDARVMGHNAARLVVGVPFKGTPAPLDEWKEGP
ncbi:glycerol dehydratase reactivase beta/small subunit family protein [Planotetraspora phitsanulokensis]|uniref:PduH protein n=1 Tax=Planotetraspora phitsanulokensis TaxID=575192 RepID=A0A8J3UE94_9ACTN|nr:glycerol dehydratase reactivase beta/small subunit family protein [Planotetraspora phitsanulokensis]GII42042.1 hypothetical protein Pph01_70450 [Planotetraspora phitsanulokensis]